MDYSQKTGYKISKNEEWEQDFADTVLAMQTGYSDIKLFGDNFLLALGDKDTPGTLLGDINSAYSSWQENFDYIMELAEQALGDFGTKGENVLGEGGSGRLPFSNFESFLENASYGEGGTAENPNGGIVGGIDDATESIDDLETEANSAFSAAAKDAGEF
jgi:hypothetical protein